MDVATLRFVSPDGDRIKPTNYDKTPADLGLEDDDCLDVFIEQLGGREL